MKMTQSKCFDGQVKYSSSCEGSIKWKTGTLEFTKDDNWWRMNLVFSCTTNGRPALSILLTPEAIKKTVCRESGCFFDCKQPDKNLISIHFRPKNTGDIKELEAIFAETMSAKTVVKVNKSEVAVQSVPQKSGLFTSIGNMNYSTATEVVDASSPKKFTSVKENKKIENDMMSGDGKENHLLNSNRLSNNFLQRSVEKSQNYLSSISSFYGKSAVTVQPLYSSTPQTINVKRAVGLMPDPTPSKRPRLSESISYTMKPKSTQPVDQNNQQSLQGFSNLGNTCYMNAILQSLFCLDSFCSDLTANRKLRNLPPQSLYYALAKLLCARRQTSENCRRDCLRRVKSAISNTAKRFSGYNQHDAHEFLGQVLDQLKEEVVKVSKSTPSPCLKENVGEDFDEPAANNHIFNPITVNFEFEVMHTLTCLKCHEQVTKTEQFHDISLDVPKHKSLFTPRSLQDALTLFFKTEQFDYTCEKCGHNKSEVSHKITRLPRVFILHLKRYTYNQQSSKNTKMGQNVAIPAYVTFQAHCTKDTQPATGLTFQAHCGGGGGEGQAVYSSVERSCSAKKSMTTTPVDSKDNIPSRRKLEYSGYRFQTTNDNTSLEQHKEVADVCFTETKDKVDSLDNLPPKSLTLEDDDSDYAKAIELSLKEQEERDQLQKDYGEDTESSFEKVLELSRHENATEDFNKKRLQDLTDDEMLQIAIEQSLMDTDSLKNVFMNNDTSQEMDYECMQNDDIISNDVREHDYIGSYDIGPDGDYLNTQISKSRKSYCRNRNNVDRVMLVNNKDSVKQELYKSDGTTIDNSAVVSEDLKLGNHELLNTSINGDTTSDSVRKHEDEIDLAETSSKFINKREIRNQHFSEKLHNLSSKFSSEDDLLCKEELVDWEEASNYGSGNKMCNGKSNLNGVSVSNRQTNELHDNIDASHRENTNNSIDLNRTITEKNGNRENLKEDIQNDVRQSVQLDTEKVKFVKHTSNKSGNKSGTRTDLGECSKETVNVGVNSPTDINNSLPRTCDLTNKEVNVNEESIVRQKCLSENDKESSEDDIGLSNDRDDSWLSLVDDKENAIPYTNSPKLSDPSEFSDPAEAPTDETDGFVEEILDLPEIINEKGELPYSYKLVSIVNHIGLSSTTGHYKSDVYDMKKKTWYTIDDVRVEKTSEAAIRVERERTGYIFFYMNKDIFDALAP